ncbi:SoxR reducing system RseC family protein [bacterium]|nr:SoxR reducing system RseC family protein [bacterium]
MKEIGKILENKNSLSVVEVGREYCDSCISKEKCLFHKERDKIIEAENIIDAKPGDLVLVEVPSKNYIISTFIIYIVPIIFMFIGAILGEFYFKKIVYKGVNISSIIFSFIFLIVALFITKILQKFIFFRPKVEEIIKK